MGTVRSTISRLWPICNRIISTNLWKCHRFFLITWFFSNGFLHIQCVNRKFYQIWNFKCSKLFRIPWNLGAFTAAMPDAFNAFYLVFFFFNFQGQLMSVWWYLILAWKFIRFVIIRTLAVVVNLHINNLNGIIMNFFILPQFVISTYPVATHIYNILLFFFFFFYF